MSEISNWCQSLSGVRALLVSAFLMSEPFWVSALKADRQMSLGASGSLQEWLTDESYFVIAVTPETITRVEIRA
jgi:hypothetical protein